MQKQSTLKIQLTQALHTPTPAASGKQPAAPSQKKLQAEIDSIQKKLDGTMAKLNKTKETMSNITSDLRTIQTKRAQLERPLYEDPDVRTFVQQQNSKNAEIQAALKVALREKLPKYAATLNREQELRKALSGAVK
jgi:chromosome segregation ATPase